MGKYSTTASRAARLEEVARRTAAGESEREIARALGVSRTTVWTNKQVAAATSAKS